MIVFWTDGSAVPNPGAGGFAVIDQATGEPVALGRGEKTTNIRMEAQALIAAMRLADGKECEIHTDSHFWIDVLTKWAKSWEAKEWKKGRDGDEEIQNLDLVQEAYQLYQDGEVSLVWEKAHVGTDLNEMADEWANRAREGQTFGNLPLKNRP